jgi:hypothetical protein
MQKTLNIGSLEFYLGKAKWLQGAIVLWPLVAGFVPEKPVYLAPPLGPLSDLVSFFFLMVAMVGIAPWFLRTRRLAIVVVFSSMVICAVCLFFYATEVNSTVVKLEAFNPNSVARVSIGTRRSEFAQKNLADKSDIEMLKDYGHREEDIQKLWTPASIANARMKLLFTYVIFLMFLNVGVGSIAKAGVLQESNFIGFDDRP